ncbi:ATPase [Candidatus Peregrinibacteria bacterium CG10_big_fil_rev_8_21_14_0_10_49_24]|nr:MAG: ATPase [Candidatus Peregrinibacteria bacterium CG11_big_fil_rev_8_21_14_0_20_49_14]PIR51184.1 MAG: ATPase [Candidatus Peregrinibacteria bacterium CG10_big_fil_rev_8_21_14_0_10_49_24]PJA67223.1 MAG: ATPase [Candidatus Peregrinibacteria bacterium CG_4_9_14_3_um_filter_49_12]
MQHHDHDHTSHTAHSGSTVASSCCAPKKKHDLILIGTLVVIATSVIIHLLFPRAAAINPLLGVFDLSVYELLLKMSWGIILGVVAVGIMDMIPREFIMSILGKGGTFTGILRATAAGVLLDLCSHGILLVGTKLYERGASLGQVMAFLIASPWNSFSLTLILWALIGFKWMITFLLTSFLIAIISGFIFDRLVEKGVLPENPNKTDLNGFEFWKEFRSQLKQVKITPSLPFTIIANGLRGSTMILRWIFFGIILAATIRTFVNPETFAVLFGPTMKGLGLTLIFATILEVCSEGSIPVAADLLTRARSVGNSFAFLMAGVSTDYTEILALKETTKSWKIAFFLPLITLPQVVLIAALLNSLS